MFTSKDLLDHDKLPLVSVVEVEEVEEENIGLISNRAGQQYGTFQGTQEAQESTQLQQAFNGRHIRMLGLAGGISTAMFLNMGIAIADGGPLGALIGYVLVGLALCAVTLNVGEMGALVPLSGQLLRYTEFFVDPALTFAIGWNQVYSCLVALPAEITAASLFFRFWSSGNDVAWITLSGLIVLITCSMVVRVYAEVEYVVALVKIAFVVIFNIMALYIVCGGSSTDESATGFRHWQTPGLFVEYKGISGATGCLLGIWACARNSIYAYAGLEGIAVTASEMRNPREVIPKAAKRIFIRVFMFYLLTLFMIGMTVPSNEPSLRGSAGSLSQSPFVVAARLAGIKALPAIFNTAALFTAWSAANTCIIRGSRYLYGLATNGHAPMVFTRTSRYGVPIAGTALHGVCILLAYGSASSSASAVFDWLQSLVAVATLILWIMTCVTYLRLYYACKIQGIDRKERFPWQAPWQPYITWTTLIFLTVLLLAGNPSLFIADTLNLKDLISAYFNPIMVLAMYFGYKHWRGTEIVPLSDLPIQRFIDLADADPEYRPLLK